MMGILLAFSYRVTQWGFLRRLYGNHLIIDLTFQLSFSCKLTLFFGKSFSRPSNLIMAKKLIQNLDRSIL